MKSFLIRFINKKASKLTHHSGFTLGELTIALVVVTLVVVVTLPITLSKMKKVDYASYYMGYSTVKDMATNILQSVLDTEPEEPEEPENPCAFELGGVCYGTPFTPTPITKAECEQLKGDLGIYLCAEDIDYWAGAVKECGGVSKMPTHAQVDEIAQYVYNTSSIDAVGNTYGLALDVGKANDLGFTGNIFRLWSSQQCDGYSAYRRLFDTTNTGWSPEARASSNMQAVCIGEATSPSTPDDEEDDDVSDDYNMVLCDKIKKQYNIDGSDCSVTPESVQSKVTSKNFSELTPNITYVNGLKVFIGSDLEEISELSDAVDADDREGFIVYVDVNGASGGSKLWEDVFPFYILKSGKIIPAYNDDPSAGANNVEHLEVNVVYDSYVSGNREINLLLKNTNFRSAACATGYIKSSKYCDGKVQYDLCKKDYHDCRMIIKEPVKLF